MNDAAAPDTVTITAQHFEEIRSTGADVLVNVSERSLGGRSSGKVAALRAEIVERGVDEDDLMLQGVEHASWGWVPVVLGIVVSMAALLGTRSLQTALAVGGGFALLSVLAAVLKVGNLSTSLMIRATSAEQVSRVLDLVLARSGVEVRSIRWRYAVEPASQGSFTARAIEQANTRAARVAEALGMRILGVHAFREEYVLPQAQITGGGQSQGSASVAAKARMSAPMSMPFGDNLGATPSSTERSGVTVHVDYRVGPLVAR